MLPEFVELKQPRTVFGDNIADQKRELWFLLECLRRGDPRVVDAANDFAKRPQAEVSGRGLSSAQRLGNGSGRHRLGLCELPPDPIHGWQ
jgi:hypothetical protein